MEIFLFWVIWGNDLVKFEITRFDFIKFCIGYYHDYIEMNVELGTKKRFINYSLWVVLKNWNFKKKIFWIRGLGIVLKTWNSGFFIWIRKLGIVLKNWNLLWIFFIKLENFGVYSSNIIFFFSYHHSSWKEIHTSKIVLSNCVFILDKTHKCVPVHGRLVWNKLQTSYWRNDIFY